MSRSSAMERFSPKFSEFWLPQLAAPRDREAPEPAKAATSPLSQEEALEQLTERINAARSII
jgi:hypothetical protein